MSFRPKRPADRNKLAKLIVDLAVGNKTDPLSKPKNPRFVELGKLGGKKGGPARSKSLSQKTRTRIAKKAAKARWGKR